ncbi:MAG: BatA domain-containing protein [Flavitalea sp.]
MLQFLNPIWFWLSAGIIIPVAIHLWNIRQSRILRIGSTMLIAEATQKSASSLKISQWLLLALRCLLIIALAAILAEPSFRPADVKTVKGWVVFDKAQSSLIYKPNKKTIDSLLNAGYELHGITKGFPAFKISDTARTDTVTKTSAWSLISRLDHLLPAGFNVHLYPGEAMTSIASLLDNAGGRPAISVNLTITGSQNSDSLYTKAFNTVRQLNDQSLRTLSFTTGTEGSYFESKNTSDVNSTAAVADTTTITISIYGKVYSNELIYLSAALNTIRSFGKYKLTVKHFDNKSEIPAGSDWVFWLAQETVPDHLTNLKLFRYAEGNPINYRSSLNLVNSKTDNALPSIYKLIIDTSDQISKDESLWTDGFGAPVLTRANGKNEIYTFFSRFEPSWSDISWSTEFPDLILNLIFSQKDSASVAISELRNKFDLRQASVNQNNPTFVKSTLKTIPGTETDDRAQKVFWIIALLLFIAERIFSGYSSNTKAAAA